MQRASKERAFLPTLYLIILIVLLVIGAILVLAFDLPAMFIVGAIVQKLAAVAEATESGLFVVLTDVGLVIPGEVDQGELVAIQLIDLSSTAKLPTI